jgi:hypothetical protein
MTESLPSPPPSKPRHPWRLLWWLIAFVVGCGLLAYAIGYLRLHVF